VLHFQNECSGGAPCDQAPVRAEKGQRHPLGLQNGRAEQVGRHIFHSTASRCRGNMRGKRTSTKPRPHTQINRSYCRGTPQAFHAGVGISSPSIRNRRRVKPE